MIAARTPQPVPYDEFLVMENAGEDRHEWVNGVVYAMNRGTPEHSRLTARVMSRSVAPLLDDGCEGFSSRTADGWSVQVAKAGETMDIHGREIPVNAIYA